MAEVTNICVFGLGEAGSLLASDLLVAGAEVSAYDPAEVATPDGVMRYVHPALAVRNADVVLGLTSGSDARLALLQSLEAIGLETVYADLSTGSPQMKTELAGFAGSRDIPFADVALMAIVPGNGIATPSLAAGTGADQYCRIVNELGGQVDAIDGPSGTAAAKKLLRSVMMKGTAAVLVEAIKAGAAFDDLEWLWSNLGTEISEADERWLRRLVVGSKTHARRRMQEMEEAVAMLNELDTPSVMTAATVASLAQLVDGELPDLPGSPDPADLGPELEMVDEEEAPEGPEH
ncbi:MAG: DUF1932 domain-containing protein [Acidimicrobiales bacterium]